MYLDYIIIHIHQLFNISEKEKLLKNEAGESISERNIYLMP